MNLLQVIWILLFFFLELSIESVVEISSNFLECILGFVEFDEFLVCVYEKLIIGCYNILVNYVDFNSGLDEFILEECFQYLEKQLESSQVCKVMEEFFFDSGEFVQIMMVIVNENFFVKFCN